MMHKLNAKIFIPSMLVLMFSFTIHTIASEYTAKQFMHMVFFKLVDDSPKAKGMLIAACKQYLSGHGGEVFFSVGSIAENKARDVNVRDFDVSLIIVFDDEAAQDNYQNHPRHKKFIKTNQDNWSRVRVFDSIRQ